MSKGPSTHGDVGLIIIERLHRLVSHGYRPWLGYSDASSQHQDIHLRRGSEIAMIYPDGSVWFVFKVALAHARADADGNLHHEALAIFRDDAENFDALFAANPPPPGLGRLVRRWWYGRDFKD